MPRTTDAPPGGRRHALGEQQLPNWRHGFGLAPGPHTQGHADTDACSREGAATTKSTPRYADDDPLFMHHSTR